MVKILNIIETAYRATIEEQDDTVLWFCHSLRNAGAELAIVLRAGAVNYAAQGQDATGLTFGQVAVAHPPQLDRDVAALIESGVEVYVVQEDVAARGLWNSELVPAIKTVSQADLPAMIGQYDLVFHW